MVGASELIFLSKTIPKIVKIFRPAAPKWGRRPSFDLRRAPQAGSGGVEAFLGENCPNPRDLSATSPAPEAFLGVPQHVIFAFRFQNERARVFFWGQNELAQFSSEGGFELALFFFWADFGFFLGPFRASSVSWLCRPGPTLRGIRAHARTRPRPTPLSITAARRRFSPGAHVCELSRLVTLRTLVGLAQQRFLPARARPFQPSGRPVTAVLWRLGAETVAV